MEEREGGGSEGRGRGREREWTSNKSKKAQTDDKSDGCLTMLCTGRLLTVMIIPTGFPSRPACLNRALSPSLKAVGLEESRD